MHERPVFTPRIGAENGAAVANFCYERRRRKLDISAMSSELPFAARGVKVRSEPGEEPKYCQSEGS